MDGSQQNKQYKLPQLTDEFLYQIIFCMEDQSNAYCLDLQDGQLMQVDFVHDRREKEPSRFLDLPLWKPSDGFRTMDKFVSSLRNPIYRERLKDVLQSGKGVFRQFKDVLKEQPSLERLWYYFKDKEIRNVIYLWYERNDDAFRLSRLAMEPEDDADDLLQEDFIVTSDGKPWVEAVKVSIDRFVNNMESNGNAAHVEAQIIKHRYEVALSNTHSLVALSSDGVFAGCIVWLPLDDRSVEVLYYGIEPEYRGMGLYKFLFDHMSRRLSRVGVTEIQLILAGDGLKTSSMFDTVSPTLIAQKISMKTRHWNEVNESTDLAYL